MIDYTLIILAGGQGQRMGGADKGLIELDGKPLVAHLLDNLRPRPSRIVISANRNTHRYQQWGDLVVKDLRDGFPGPLAGLEAALAAVQGLCLCLPCDLLDPPATMAGDLLSASATEHVCVARDATRRQPLCLALHAEPWHATLVDYLDSGKRSAHGWLEQLPVKDVDLAATLENMNQPA